LVSAGIEFGGTKCLGVAIDERGNVLREHQLPTPYEADDLIDTIIDIAKRLEPYESIGVGAAGLVCSRLRRTLGTSKVSICALD
jgi:predicted NBD/HSP70 family sugar kinase